MHCQLNCTSGAKQSDSCCLVTLMTSEDRGCIAPVHFMSCSTPVFLPLRYILLRAARTAGSLFTYSCSCISTTTPGHSNQCEAERGRFRGGVGLGVREGSKTSALYPNNPHEPICQDKCSLTALQCNYCVLPECPAS